MVSTVPSSFLLDSEHDSTFDEMTSRCGSYNWSSVPPRDVRGRRGRHNIIRSDGHPAPHVQPTSIVEAFGYFITDAIVSTVITHTNEEAARAQLNSSSVSLESQWSDTTYREILGFIGLLIYAGVTKSNMVDVRDLWSESRGFHIFRATMSRCRFENLRRFLRFDDKTTRSVRRMTDKLAPCRQIWNILIQRCKENYIPGPLITVDEMMIPYRGKAPFKIYMPSKPDP